MTDVTDFTGDGLLITPQDLSSISPQQSDDDRTFHHNGSSEIELVGGVTDSERGLFTWDHAESAWHPLFRNVDKIDGKEAGDFLLRDGSTSMEGSLDLSNNKLVNVSEAEGGTGGIHLNTNNVELHAHSTGADIRFLDSNDLLLVEVKEGGNFNIPNGSITEGGNRVATRTWTENTADVANADHADDATTLQGNQPASFLQVSGDQMEGTLDLGGFDLNDGGSQIYDSTNGVFIQSTLGGPSSSLTSYPLPDEDLAENYALTSRFPIPESDVGFSLYTDTDAQNAISGTNVSVSTLSTSGGIEVEGSNHHTYAGIRAGSNASSGHLMLDSYGGDILLNWEDGGDVRLGEGGGRVEYDGNEVATRTWVNNNGGISATNFEIVENSSTNSLDFNYTG
jgi:hypothetical protein